MRNTSDPATPPDPVAPDAPGVIQPPRPIPASHPDRDAGRDTPTAAGAPASGHAAPDTPAATARTPDEYDETPGLHRRPSDNAALDVGG